MRIRHVAMARSLETKEDMKNIPLMVEEDEEVEAMVKVYINIATTKIR